MTAPTHQRRRGTGREHLLDAALRLFAADGVEATSLQNIADAAGVTKAGVYYHYKTKDEIVLDVLAPLLDTLPAITRRAEAHRTRAARTDEIIAGLVDLTLEHLGSFAVVLHDPYVARLLLQHRPLQEWWEHVTTLVAGPDPQPQARAALAVFVSGLPGACRSPALAGLEEAELRGYLLECGRRLLQVRRRYLKA